MLPSDQKDALQRAFRTDSGRLSPERLRGPRGPRTSRLAQWGKRVQEFENSEASRQFGEFLWNTWRGKILTGTGAAVMVYFVIGIVRCISVVYDMKKPDPIYFFDWWWLLMS